MKSLTENIKSFIIIIMVIVLVLFSGTRLMEIQVVGDENIKEPEQYAPGTLSYVHEIKATRGEIVDYNGNILVTNNARCDLVLKKAFFPDDLKEGNKILLEIYNALKEHGFEFKESIPITKDKPYVFTVNDASEIISNLNLNVYASAENCIDKLIEDYEIDESYSDEEKRIIAGMRYEMIAKDFSYEIDLTLAENIDSQTVIDMKELSNIYKGIEISETSERSIVRGDILPHEIGTVGPIYAEEYDELKNQGYAMDDTLGKSGIESAMEKELRGINGKEEVLINDGSVVDVKTITHTSAGASVKLTVDGNFQLKLQNILNNFIKNFPSINPKPNVLKDTNCGAIAVIDCKTGAVKGFATAPTYNLKDYAENFDYFLNAKDSPLLNRCTWGLYRPGSTFKTITATAGLNEGVVTADTLLRCDQVYYFYGGKYGCTGHHYDISMRRAIEVSCNIYFYEVSRALGIDNITRYAKLYGLGSSTGIETGDAAGYLCNPETFAENGIPWYVGYVIQAGIGNQDAGITPLQMAVVASTIGNRGVRYKPYLVDSLHEYGTNKLISETQPTIAEKINLSYDDLYDPIIAGMIDASHNMPVQYSLQDLGFDVAIKTGTPQTGADLEQQNSFFIGFAPADDPEIAFAGVVESAEYSKYMIRDIILAYQECYGLNGVQPTVKPLPEEVRPAIETTDASSSETTTASSSETTTTTTETTSVTTSAAPATEPVPSYTDPPVTDIPYTEPQTTQSGEPQTNTTGEPPVPGDTTVPEQ